MFHMSDPLGLVSLGALGGLGYLATDNDWFGNASDYLSGYTSANAAQRFALENLAVQQMYNEKNMELQQGYNEKNMKQQQVYNEKNMDLTDTYQRQMMRDSPSLQVAALRRAGLNPLLAVNNGITSAGTAVHASNPSSSTPQSSSPMPSGPSVNPQIGIGDVVGGLGMLSGLAKLGPEIDLLKSQALSQKTSSAESAARTIKTMKESDSIDPSLEKEVKARSKSWLGQMSNDILNMFNPKYDSPSAQSASPSSLGSISTHSAQSVDQSVKRIEKALDGVHVLPRMRHETSSHSTPVKIRKHN